MESKIDLVYLWLDGKDKKWRAEKEKWRAIESGKVELIEEGVTEARCRDNDELLYSLRSVDKFAPWINHIYIVTGFGQVPDWLDTTNPKITIVDDSQIMPADALPTFNSMAIECCLVNIPGLSERFLYANDDMFFGRPVTPDFFFDARGRAIVWTTKGRKKSTFVKSIKRAYSGYHTVLFHTAKLFENVFGENMMDIAPSHNIDPYFKSTIKDLLTNPMIDLYCQKTIHRKFRSTFDMQRWIFSLYDLAFGKAVRRKVFSPKSRRHIFYNMIHSWLGSFKKSPCYTINAKKDNILNIRPALFCINDTEKNMDQDFADNAEFLKELLPEKSQFEK